MILMAIDHVRVYSGVPAGGPEAGVFFTRWITHFCAPAFAFYAGTSAFLYGSKINDRKKLSLYLLTRGILLVILELTVLRFFWAFHVDSQFILAGVIWMLGWCMILMAALVRFSPRSLGIAGLAIILFQQIFMFVPKIFPDSLQADFAKGWEFIYPSNFETFGGVFVLYSIVPWIGVMMTGYAFGMILTMDPQRRDKLCIRIGVTCIALYLIIGTAFILLRPNPEAPPFIFRLLNQSKYPASQLFLMMTLGPVILLTPLAERASNAFTNLVAVVGRVPFFFYLLHIPLIHMTALLVQLFRDGSMHHEWFIYAPYTAVPEQFRWSLPLLYLVFLIDIVILIAACRWYATYKSLHRKKRWLMYV